MASAAHDDMFLFCGCMTPSVVDGMGVGGRRSAICVFSAQPIAMSVVGAGMSRLGTPFDWDFVYTRARLLNATTAETPATRNYEHDVAIG